MRVEEQNREVIQQIHQAMERDGFTAHADFFADQSLNHGFPASREMVRAILRDIFDTFPDVRLEPHNVLAEGEWVVGRYTFSGTHTGTGRHPFVHGGLLAGVPPTGRSVSVQHIHMFRLKDGQIVEHWANRDDVEMMRQLGLHPPMTPPGHN